MPPISTITLATVLGGVHLATNAPQSFARVNSRLISVIGTEVAMHPPNSPPHKAPSQGGSCLTATGATWARINGIPICRDGDTASCDHPNENGEAFARINDGGGAGDFGLITAPPDETDDYGSITSPPDETEDWGSL